MATQPEPIQEGVPLANTHVLYADLLSQLAVGPHMSKLVFGREVAPGTPPVAAFTIAMPTPALKVLVENITAFLARDDVQRSFRDEYAKLLADESEPSKE